MATVMGKAVADDEVVGAKNAVVAGNLAEDFLGNRDVRGLVLNDNARRSAFATVENAVATSPVAAGVQSNFVRQ